MGRPRWRSRGWPIRVRASPRGRSSSACPDSPPTATTSRRTPCGAAPRRWWCERPLDLGVPEVQVESVRAAMGPAASRFYGDPSHDLNVVGITGTNGKTTTAFLVREVLEAAGIQTGLLGTVKRVVGGVEESVERTTPEGDRPPGGLRPNALRRRPGLRNGGLVARAGAGAGVRDPLRLQGVHQPHPGPPRLPRRHGGLLPRQAQALRRARAGGGERRRPIWPPLGRRAG